MLFRNIFRQRCLISVVCLSGCFLTSSCLQLRWDVHAGPARPNLYRSQSYGQAKRIGTIANPSVTESSGLVASRTHPGLYWTHNDSGDGPYLYALDTTGASRGVWRVAGADARDWEDIAAGPGPQPGKSYLYVGDIGDNRSSRSEVVVYRVIEPRIRPADSQSSTKKPLITDAAEAIRLRYPDGKHDAEALMVHPTTGNLYIVTKVALRNASVYEAVAPLNTSKLTTMNRLVELKIPSLFGGVITGGDISPDGKRVILCDYFQGYELVLPKAKSDFDEIWEEHVTTLDLGKRSQGESIAYRLDGRAVLATSEGRASPLIEVERLVSK